MIQAKLPTCITYGVAHWSAALSKNQVLHSNVPPPFMVFEFFQNHLSSKLIYFTGKGFIIKRFMPKEFLPQYVVR